MINVREDMLRYLQHLDAGGQRITLPNREVHDPEKSKGKVHISSLGMCPLKAALRRNEAPAKYPELEDPLPGLYNMQRGTRTGEFVQEMFLFNHPETKIEVSFDNGLVRGRADVVIGDSVIEVKSPLTKAEPKLNYLFQVMAYGMIGNVPNMYLLILPANSLSFKLWKLVPVGTGYVLMDENEVQWDSPLNTPEILNFDNLRDEIERHWNYLHGHRTAPPVTNFMNNPAGDECWKWGSPKLGIYETIGKAKQYAAGRPIIDVPPSSPQYEEGKRFYVPGQAAVKCPWFCHHNEAQPTFSVGISDEGLIPLLDIGVF